MEADKATETVQRRRDGQETKARRPHDYGRLESMGTLYGGRFSWNQEVVGRVEPPHIQFSGAVLRLILR